MTTLHQYHWRGFKSCQQKLPLMTDDDTLLIYGDFTEDDQYHFLKAAPKFSHRCFWLHHKPSQHTGIHNIDHQQWLTLITEHDKTHTWK
mgnify:CR=1 FL=1